jgi:hypothetical protein
MGARLCPKDQPPRPASAATVAFTKVLRLVRRTQLRATAGRGAVFTETNFYPDGNVFS